MKRRVFLYGIGITVSLSGCLDDNENSPPTETPDGATDETQEQETESEPEEEEAKELDPAKFEVTNLSVDPSEVAPGESVLVIATVQNIGEKEGTEQISFDVDGTTISGQKVGDTTFEEVGEGETINEEVSISAGESVDVSIELTRELSGTFKISVGSHSVTFEVVRKWNEIGKSYEGASGLTVTLEGLELNEKTGSYEYEIEYTLANETDESLDEGGFQLYPADPDDEPLQQFGSFDKLFPGDSVSKTYTFEENKSIEFSMLSYHPDQFFSKIPPADALVWPVNTD